MDALALLCNLHADGPLTLQRLRRLGCESLAGLIELEASSLASELDGDEAIALRFQREAGLLAVRLEEVEGVDLDALKGSLEQEVEQPEPVVQTAESFDEPLAQQQDVEEEIGEVLAAWRSLDEEAPPAPPSNYCVPRPKPVAEGNQALEDVGIDGLSRELADRFAEVGVLSLRGLVDAPAIELSRELSLPFTHVKRFQFLAKRAISEVGSSTEAAPVAAEFEQGDDRLETAGPFA